MFVAFVGTFVFACAFYFLLFVACVPLFVLLVLPFCICRLFAANVLLVAPE